MYIKSAKFYNHLYAFKDYELAAEKLYKNILQYLPNATSFLDVACGTGLHLKHLRTYFDVEGLDISAELLSIAREDFPDLIFHQADMTDFELSRKFDVIACLFSSIGYVKTKDRLDQAIAAMARHLQPNGLLVIEPWLNPDQYWRNKIVANFVDEPDLKISWMYAHELEGTVSVFNIHYLVGTPEGVEHFTERHEVGLFTQEEYTAAFVKASLQVEYDAQGLFGRGMYIARKNTKA